MQKAMSAMHRISAKCWKVFTRSRCKAADLDMGLRFAVTVSFLLIVMVQCLYLPHVQT